MWYVYILRCNDLSYYTGLTNDVPARVKAHNKGKGAKYTKSRLPVSLVYYEELPDKVSAMKRELEIKGYSKAKKERLLKNNICRFPSPLEADRDSIP